MSDTDSSDKKKQYNKTYYDKHREKWTAKVTCDQCGGTYCLNNKSNHMSSKKHKTAVMAVIIKHQEKEINNLKYKLQIVN